MSKRVCCPGEMTKVAELVSKQTEKSIDSQALLIEAVSRVTVTGSAPGNHNVSSSSSTRYHARASRRLKQQNVRAPQDLEDGTVQHQISNKNKRKLPLREGCETAAGISSKSSVSKIGPCHLQCKITEGKDDQGDNDTQINPTKRRRGVQVVNTNSSTSSNNKNKMRQERPNVRNERKPCESRSSVQALEAPHQQVSQSSGPNHSDSSQLSTRRTRHQRERIHDNADNLSGAQALEAPHQHVSQSSGANQAERSQSSRSSNKRARQRRERIVVDTSNLLGVHCFDSTEEIMSVGAGMMFTMHRVEQHIRADPDYLDKQGSLTPVMRATLFDWMFEVGQEFVLSRETLHTALNYVDRFLSLSPDVPKSDLQLVGVTSLWTAAKNKEVHAPKAIDFASSTNNAYSVKQLCAMEVKILKTLRWAMDPVTCVGWTDCYMKNLAELMDQANELSLDDGEESNATAEASSPDFASLSVFHRSSSGTPALVAPVGNTTRNHGRTPLLPSGPLYDRVMELIDVALLDIDSLNFFPSEIAASALLHVALDHFTDHAHTVELATRYTREDLQDSLQWMARFVWDLPFNARREHPRSNLIRMYHPQQDWHCLQRHNAVALDRFKSYHKRMRENAGRHAQQQRQQQPVIVSSNGGNPSIPTILRPTPVRAAPAPWTGNIDPTPNNARAARPRWPANDENREDGDHDREGYDDDQEMENPARPEPPANSRSDQQQSTNLATQEFDPLVLEANETLT